MQIINRFIKKLSQIAIDVDKDWGGHLIRNLGAPTASGDALRRPATLGTDVPHDALANLTERAHSSLTSVGASDHHTRYADSEAVAAVEAAGLALASGKRVKLIQSLSADHSWSGLTATLTAGEALAIGNAVYVKSDGKAGKANASAVGTMPNVAVATGTISQDAAGEFLLAGFMRDDSWTWTPGGFLYVNTTAGDLTQTKPSGSGHQVQVVGVAVTADIILFNPSYELVEVS